MDDTVDYQRHYKRIVETLKFLASSYKDQMLILPDYVYLPSEIITSFNDIFLLLPPLVE